MTVHQDCILQVIIIHHKQGHILQHLSTNLINVLLYVLEEHILPFYSFNYNYYDVV